MTKSTKNDDEDETEHDARGNATNKSSTLKMGEHHRRMNELSGRIKREALESMNFESSYVGEKEKLMGGNLEGGGGRHNERVDDTTVMVSGEESLEYSFA